MTPKIHLNSALVAILIFIIGSGSGIFFEINKSSKEMTSSNSSLVDQKLNLNPNKPNLDSESQSSNILNSLPISSTSSQDVNKDFKDYRSQLYQIVDSQSPRQALQKIAVDLENSKLVQEHCHSFSHAIGNQTLQKYKNDIKKSLEYNIDVCGGGYVHGIIEKYIDLNSDSGDSFLDICDNSSQPSCFHALGHGLMIRDKNDVEQSIKNCKKLTNIKQQNNCGEGVFMQKFDLENPSEPDVIALNSSKEIRLCQTYDYPFRSGCFYYFGRYTFNDIKKPDIALSKCLDNEIPQDIADCTRGTSSGIVRSNLKNPQIIESLCNQIPDYISNCILGGINYHLLMFEDSSRTKDQMCEQFVVQNSNLKCNQLLESTSFKT